MRWKIRGKLWAPLLKLKEIVFVSVSLGRNSYTDVSGEFGRDFLRVRTQLEARLFPRKYRITIRSTHWMRFWNKIDEACANVCVLDVVRRPTVWCFLSRSRSVQKKGHEKLSVRNTMIKLRKTFLRLWCRTLADALSTCTTLVSIE